MKGSCRGAKPLLSQCLQMVWHLHLYKVAVLAAVSFNSGVEVLKGCLDRRELQCGSPLTPIALQLDEIKYFYFSLNEPIKPEENVIDDLLHFRL